MLNRISTDDFISAVANGNLVTVQQYIAENINNVDALVQFSKALSRAAFFGYSDIVRELLKIPKIDVNTTLLKSPTAHFLMGYFLAIFDDNTPLMCAAAKGHTDIVRQLLAVPNIVVHKVNRSGLTALICALMLGQDEICDLLINASQEGFDREVLLSSLTNEVFLEKKEQAERSKIVLLTMRDRSTPFGKLCQRRLDFSKRCSVKTFFEEERKFTARINAALRPYCAEQDAALNKKKTIIIANQVDWDGMAQIVKLGADPNLLVSFINSAIRSGILPSFEQTGILPSFEQMESLLSFGLMIPNIENACLLPENYLRLSLQYGGDGWARSPKTYSKSLTLLDLTAQNVSGDKTLLSNIPELLNYEVPFTDEANVFTAIIEWLSQARPEEVTPNICAYLKPHKLKMLKIIEGYSDDEALPILKEIFDNQSSALGKVFFQGNAAINAGKLKLVHAEYIRRQAVKKPLPIAKGSLDDQLKGVLNAFPFDADAAMTLVRNGADPHTRAADGVSLIYQLVITKSDDRYIQELLEHPRGFVVQYFPQSHQPIPTDFFITAIMKFVELGANPALFDAEIDADLLFDEVCKRGGYKKEAYLLAMRDPQQLLGKITRRQPRPSSEFSQFECDRDKRMIAKINALTGLRHERALVDLIYKYSIGCGFDTESALKLIRQGANPNAVVQKSQSSVKNYRIKDIIRQTMGTANRFTLAQLEELLMYGLDLSIAKKPLFVATPDLYDYVTLIMHYGCHPSIAMPQGSEGLTILDCVLRDADFTKPTDVARIFDLLNYGVKITAKNDKKMMSALLAWLMYMSGDQLTDTVLNYLKEFKDQLLDVMALIPDKELSFLTKVFQERDSALSKVFFAGHPMLSEGRLGRAHKRYCELKDLNEKSVASTVDERKQNRLTANKPNQYLLSSSTLHSLVSGYDDVSVDFPWDKALQAIRNGENVNCSGNVTTRVKNQMMWHTHDVRLTDVLHRCLLSNKVPSLEVVKELLEFGLDFNTAMTQKGAILKTLAGRNLYDHALLFIQFGEDYYISRESSEVLGLFKRSVTVLDSLLEKIGNNPLTAQDILLITELLNCKVPITLKENSVFVVLLNWLDQIPADQVTLSMLSYLENFKDQLLQAMQTLPAKELAFLTKIFEEKDTALSKVFFAGGADINSGRLGKPHERYCELKDPPSLFDAPRETTLFDRIREKLGTKRDAIVTLGRDDASSHGVESAQGYMSNNL